MSCFWLRKNPTPERESFPRHWRYAHSPHHLETIAQIGEGLDVAAPHQCLIGGRAAAQPLGIELAHVTLSERAVLAQAGPLCGSKLWRKDEERAEHQTHEKEDDGGDLCLEVGQRGLQVEDPVRNQSGNHRPVCDGERGEREGYPGEGQRGAGRCRWRASKTR